MTWAVGRTHFYHPLAALYPLLHHASTSPLQMNMSYAAVLYQIKVDVSILLDILILAFYEYI